MYNDDLKSESDVIKLVQEKAKLREATDDSSKFNPVLQIFWPLLGVPQSVLLGHPDILSLYKPEKLYVQREAE